MSAQVYSCPAGAIGTSPNRQFAPAVRRASALPMSSGAPAPNRGSAHVTDARILHFCTDVAQASAEVRYTRRPWAAFVQRRVYSASRTGRPSRTMQSFRHDVDLRYAMKRVVPGICGQVVTKPLVYGDGCRRAGDPPRFPDGIRRRFCLTGNPATRRLLASEPNASRQNEQWNRFAPASAPPPSWSSSRGALR
jgi:hypothetical protein